MKLTHLAKKRKKIMIFQSKILSEQPLYSIAIPLFLQDKIFGFIGLFSIENIHEEMKVSLEMFAKCINIELMRILTMKDLYDFINNNHISYWENILSNREIEVVRMVIAGYKDNEIEKKLFISKSTVRAHIGNIFEKLEVTSRLELIEDFYSYLLKEIKRIIENYEV